MNAATIEAGPREATRRSAAERGTHVKVTRATLPRFRDRVDLDILTDTFPPSNIKPFKYKLVSLPHPRHVVKCLTPLEASAPTVPALLIRSVLVVPATAARQFLRLSLDAVPDRVMKLGTGRQATTATTVDPAVKKS